YLVPVGRADLNRSERRLTIDLDKATLKRYPEFHADEFDEMTDEEARRYEWRVLEAVDPAAARSSGSTWDYDRYPYYQQPEWFDPTALGTTDRSTTTSGRRSEARNVPVE